MATMGEVEEMANSVETLFDKGTTYLECGGPSTQGLPEASEDQVNALWGHQQQATVGDNTTARPGMFDFKGKKKWDAWANLEGMPKKAAMERFMDLLDSTYPTWKDWKGEMGAGAYVVPTQYSAADLESWLTIAQGYSEDQDGWEPWFEADGVTVARKTIDQSGLMLRREVGRINAEASKVFEFMRDFDKRKEWDELLDTYTRVKDLGDNGLLLHYKTKAVSRVVWPRDFLVAVGWKQLEDGSYLRVGRSVRDDTVMPADPAYVRASVLWSVYRVKPLEGGECEVTDVKQVDIGGWIPENLKNNADKKVAIGLLRKCVVAA